MAADPNTLTSNATGLTGIPEGMQLPVLIYIFAQIAGMSANPNTLVANAAPLTGIPEGMQMLVLISLAYSIAGGGGGGTLTQVYVDTQANLAATVPSGKAVGIVTDSTPANQLAWYNGSAWNF